MQRYTVHMANSFLPNDDRVKGQYGLPVYLAQDVETLIADLRRKWESGEANAVTDFLAAFSADR
jgi:hypothetical protein